jgi:hypothetical protein
LSFGAVQGAAMVRGAEARAAMVAAADLGLAEAKKFKAESLQGIRLRRRPFAIKMAVQMIEHPKRRLKSDHHIVDLPTVALAAAVVVLLVAACVVPLVSH